MDHMATLTIQINAEQLARAEQIARARNMSVEAYVARLVDVVTQPPPRDEELGPITRSLRGVLAPMSDDEVKAAVEEYRQRKYGSAGQG
jgi:hypothetical protein